MYVAVRPMKKNKTNSSTNPNERHKKQNKGFHIENVIEPF